uniref:Uncharacterized protein n=1 Tax=Arundo donax TaxID=35708 RepID=A0A0A8YM96_ARUDO
MDCSLAGII